MANESHAGTLDNICGALARIIVANSQLVPLKDVLPVFVNYLPLREDFSENLAVFKCLALVYQQGNDVMVPLLGQIAGVGIQVLGKKQFNDDAEAEQLIAGFLRELRQSFPEPFNTAAAAAVDPEIASFLQTF